MRLTTRARSRAASLLSVGLAVAGAAALAGLLAWGRAPSPWWLWLAFTATFAALEFAAVEVSDRVRISSAMMVAFTAAVVFGREAAPPAVALMAALSMLQPEDIRQRRWQQPLFNCGQLVLSSSAGMLIFAMFMPEGQMTADDIPRLVAGAVAGAAVYNYLNFRLVAGFVRFTNPGRDLGRWSEMLPNHLALATLAVLGALLGAAYVLVGGVVVPLILFTYLVGFAGFSTHSRMRRSHEAAIRGFVKVVEALDPYTRGHTERVAHFCRITAEELGLTRERAERLRWAALIHDVGRLAIPGALLDSSNLTPEQHEEAVRRRRVVEGVLAEVAFLRPMVEINAASHGVRGSVTPWRLAPLEARILAAVDAFDARTTTRSYRAAITQEQAFAELRAEADRFGSDVVDAFEAAVRRRGEVYGSPDDESAQLVHRLVRERAIRA